MAAYGEASKLACIMRTVVKDQIKCNEPIALMFSGGLDSSVLAVIARKYSDLKLYTIGFKDSHDMVWGEECARVLDLPFKGILVQNSDVALSLERVVASHKMMNPKWMSTFVSFDIALSKIPEGIIICGQGADELFGGYRKYALSADAENLMAADTTKLADREWPAYVGLAHNHSKALIAPYLDSRMIAYARSLPMELKLTDSSNKLVLRNAAMFLGVPGMMASKQKKAMQYGSGISKSIKHHLKEKGISLPEFIECNKP